MFWLLADMTEILGKLDPIVAVLVLGNGYQYWRGAKREEALQKIAVDSAVGFARMSDLLGRALDRLGGSKP